MVPEAIAILEQVASALDYAHQRGVVHRDIKPGNVMLDVSGRVTVTDFGIAKELTGSGLTGSGAILGTPYYMSPEQCRGSQDLTGAADQYSLGVMTYQMITGQLPFEADSAIDVIHKHVSEAPPPIDKLLPGLPRHVINAVNRAMSKKPRDRFPTVMAFVGALKNAPVDATLIVDRGMVDVRDGRRTATRVAAAAGVVALLGVGTVLVMKNQRGTAAASPPPPPSIAAANTPPDSVARSVAPPPAPEAAPRPLPAPPPAVVRPESSARPASSAPATPPAPSPTDSGTARIIITNGWANISIAGLHLAERRVWNGKLAPGTHQVTFSRDGYRPQTHALVIRPGRDTPLRVTMQPEGTP